MRKLKLIVAIVLMTSVTATIYSCKKNKEEEVTIDDSADQKDAAIDESMTQNESNQALDDANNAASNAGSINGRYTSTNGFGDPICGGTLDLSDTANKKITITYDGTTVCNGRKRSGSITLTLTGANKWKDMGAVLTAHFNDLNITRVSDGKHIVINGDHIVTNKNGGLVGVDAEVVHEISGKMSILFDNNTTREWTVTRRVTITSDNSGIIKKRSVNIEGTGTDGTVISGTNRKGEAFSVIISSAIQANNICGFNRPVAGVRSYSSSARNFTLTFGLDANGSAVAAGDCAYYYRVNWTDKKGTARSMILPY